jgi:hypothetical protein
MKEKVSWFVRGVAGRDRADVGGSGRAVEKNPHRHGDDDRASNDECRFTLYRHHQGRLTVMAAAT